MTDGTLGGEPNTFKVLLRKVCISSEEHKCHSFHGTTRYCCWRHTLTLVLTAVANNELTSKK
jgi:DNA-directed RNA polymerase subunit N (RpoN/RPB10)